MSSVDSKAQTADSSVDATARIVGFDVARSFAMLGMIVVHFSLVAASYHPETGWLPALLAILDGRAAAIFVILAGIGLTLISRRAISTGDPIAIAALRRTIVRRGLFLLAIGYVNLIIWPGDILRVYGISLMLAAFLLRTSSRWLLIIAAAFACVFTMLVLTIDFAKNWDFDSVTYHNLWTPSGIVRNLFYDGFRSIFPWTGLLLFGMWLGRLDLTDRRTNRRVLFGAISVAVTAELISKLAVRYLLRHSSEDLDKDTIVAIFGTESIPAMPLFLLASAGTATALIAFCVRFVTESNRIWRPLIATGQMALTWYVAHIVVGLGALLAFGFVGTQTLETGAALGVLFFCITVPISALWKNQARHGPLEWLMRKIAG